MISGVFVSDVERRVFDFKVVKPRGVVADRVDESRVENL